MDDVDDNNDTALLLLGQLSSSLTCYNRNTKAGGVMKLAVAIGALIQGRSGFGSPLGFSMRKDILNNEQVTSYAKKRICTNQQ